MKHCLIVIIIFISSFSYAQTSGPSWVKEKLVESGVFNSPFFEFTKAYDTEKENENISGVLIKGLDYMGNPTKYFAWYGVPASLEEGQKAPAVVCVHGGGGTAFEKWVQKWNDRGYIAISMSLEGNVPGARDENNQWPTFGFSGPRRDGFFRDADKDLKDQWFYHAVADVIMANSLLRNPDFTNQVDTDHIGITGISWGGILTTVITGIDNRFDFAIPVYGCGYLQEAPLYAAQLSANTRDEQEFYLENWEPSLYVPFQSMPTLYVNGTNDKHFSMNSFTKTYRASANEKYLRIASGMRHGHRAGWEPEDIYQFADYITGSGDKRLEFTSQNLENNNTLSFNYEYDGSLSSAWLYYTVDTADWSGKGYEWIETQANLSSTSKSISVSLPVEAQAYFINAVSAESLVFSSPMVVVGQNNLTEGEAITKSLTDTRPFNFPGGRIALSHDGNNYDKDDFLAVAMNCAILDASGFKSKLVHFDHSCHIGKNLPERYSEMLESIEGGASRFSIDANKIFDSQKQLDELIANFKKEGDKSSADNPLWFCIAGPMEVPWQCINAVEPSKRKYIHCISHGPWNNEHTFPPQMTHTWEDVKKLGVTTHDLPNQNKTGWNTEIGNISWMENSINDDLRWLYSRNAKPTFDTSDSGMLWWVLTGATNGGNEDAGWLDYKPLLESRYTDGFQTIFNGKNFEGWYLKLRNGDEEMAKNVFAIDDGAVHVFKDFPDSLNLNTGENETHGLFYSKKKYSKYILRFEYKWGEKITNNFDKWQYDAGVYYHVVDDKIWPTGIEYQIRFDHTKNRNHTGDLIRPAGTKYKWYQDDETNTYLHPNDGGKLDTGKGWLHFASPTTNYQDVNDKWNQCEIIVMGHEYAIHKLNGEVVNMAFDLSPGEGIVGFQSETAEIYYRNIRIRELDEIIPAEEFLKH
ncbi:family 16 glycoside hydrolase [Fulvivirga sp. M361]|uniref:family 16 glycoside hydrolase n=1 Tax=Fulvivirga sp. M361 TaxID=2594266 RepID=UPI001624061D|nr:family 16 glycoside hydrolase [Fulvivirga sp. M361]